MLLTRRRFLAVAGAASAGLVLGSCRPEASRVGATDPAVEAAERKRRAAGAPVREVSIAAVPIILDLAGLQAATWAYDGEVPGKELRVRAGEVLRARLVNNLPEPTTIHWHGIALRNDMDGVPGVTQDAVAPGAEFTYEFALPDSGSFWFHPHVGLQLDRGLYAPLVIEDPNEPGAYDREVTVVLDDWVDGLGEPPEVQLERLRRGEGAHAAHGEGGGPREGPLQSAGGDVSYPLFLMNGRVPRDPPVFDAKPGERLRLRLVNAGADTSFRVALGGHKLTVTHADGFPVEPVEVDAVLLGMAERYDVVVTVAGSGAYPLVALAEAKGNQAMGIVRSGAGEAPPPGMRIPELAGRLLQLSELRATDAVSLPPGRPDRTHRAVLGGGEEGYRWTINGKTHDEAEPLDVRQGERIRIVFGNETTMFHPMHLHGHTFQVIGRRGGPMKDTVIVRPDEEVAVDFLAANPGQWMLHCHNVYHMEAGMMTVLSYVK